MGARSLVCVARSVVDYVSYQLLSQLLLTMWLALGGDTSLIVGVITVRVVTNIIRNYNQILLV